MRTHTLLTMVAVAPPARRVLESAGQPLATGPLAVADASFRAWPALNDEATRYAVNAGRRHRLHLQPEDATGPDPTRELFAGDALMARFGRGLAERRAIDRKEFFEACEFFARTRKRLAADGDGVLVDAAGGHGLVGALCAIFLGKQFERIIVRDVRRPKAFDAVVSAAVEVAPWVEGRIVYDQQKVGLLHDGLPRGCAVVGVHACRGLTDKIIAAAADADARCVALMPCCYEGTAADAPVALRQALGVPMAADIQRTYTLEAHGYSVAWKAIPRCISPMNRILLAHRPPRASL